MRRKAKRFLTRAVPILILAVLAHWLDQPESLAATDDVVVVDGDSLLLNGKKVRLIGIDAPESKQVCQRENGKNYGCGKSAEKHLRYLIGKHDVQCDIVGEDKYQRGLALCKAGEMAINQQMVTDGWAVPFRNAYVDYRKDARAAKQSKSGLWAGEFMTPGEWKALNPRY